MNLLWVRGDGEGYLAELRCDSYGSSSYGETIEQAIDNLTAKCLSETRDFRWLAEWIEIQRHKRRVIAFVGG